MSLQVTLAVDQVKLVHTLKHTFSSSSSVYTELAQNARRADATRIDFRTFEDGFEIEDDGSGIHDFAALLRVASSGWDEALIEREGPYGLGFLIALHSCERIEIESCGQRLDAQTADILNFVSQPITQCERITGTLIRLSGGVKQSLVMEKPHFSNAPLVGAARLFKGFPIPVTLNGQDVPRPHAANDDFVKTSIGDISVATLAGDDIEATDMHVYLQGLSISLPSASGVERFPAVIHLDPVQFHGRAPDRSLVIEEDAATRVQSALRDVVVARLMEVVKSQPDRLWNCQRALTFTDHQHLLNAVDVIPKDFLTTADCSTLDLGRREWFGRKRNLPKNAAMISRQDLENYSLIVPADVLGDWNGMPEEEPDTLAYVNIVAYVASVKGATLIETDKIPEGHWIYSLPSLVREPMVKVASYVPAEAPDHYLNTCDGSEQEIVFGSEVQLEGPLGMVPSALGYGVTPDLRIAVQQNANTWALVHAFCDFKDENDRYEEDSAERHSNRVAIAQSAAFGGNTAKLLRAALDESYQFNALRSSLGGKSFKVSIDEKGNISVEPMAD